MSSRMRRFRIALASRGGKFLTATVAALGAVLLYLL